jgi:hypothetical protein
MKIFSSSTFEEYASAFSDLRQALGPGGQEERISVL